MPHKKARVPSKDLFTIQQKISQLFEDILHESEVSDPHDPNTNYLPQDDVFKYKGKRTLKNESKSIHHSQDNPLIAKFSIPSPDPEPQKFMLNDAPEILNAETKSQILGFYCEKTSSGETSTPFTSSGKKIFEENRGLLLNETSTPGELALSLPFKSAKLKKNYQLLLEFKFDTKKELLTPSDRLLVSEVINILTTLLERTI